MEIWRRLAGGNPVAFEPDLAGALTNLYRLLPEVGRRGDALTAGEQAVEIRRRLAADNPATYEPDLALLLNSHGLHLWGLGRRGEALTAAEEAIEVYRRPATVNPAAYEFYLAGSLTAWALVRYEARQDLAGALRATGEAVEIFGRLVAAAPEQFLSPLRDVLDLQADLLTSIGRPQEARAIRAWLAAPHPARRDH
ncbi:hypothetical protein [Streptomyces sp. NPDC046821]|uniref:hypothetical protein n=1 Tax=Streptomyces sp. NPDC046821 TaxID=3154702 RepID=UPI0033DE1B8A